MHKSLLLLCVGCTPSLFAFENAKVLPPGVRNLTVRNVMTSISGKTDSAGVTQPLAQPLQKDLTFKKMVNNEKGVKKTMLQAFLLHEGFRENEAAGTYTADMSGNVHVIAPIFATGITERWTLGMALPFYQSKMKAAVGFRASKRGQEFVDRLQQPQNNLTESALEAADKMNDAVGQLNKKLVENGYERLESWSGNDIGDLTVLSKYRLINRERFQLANMSGVVAPTGSTQEQNALLSVPTGFGVWGLFTGFSADMYLRSDLFVNQYGKYTYEAPDSRRLRLATEDESIEVGTKATSFKLGDLYEAGTSIQYEPHIGLLAGIGYVYTYKEKDQYQLSNNPDAKEKLEMDTDQQAHTVEYRLGYSTLPAFQDKTFAVPVSTTVEYKQVIASRNTLVKNLISVDLMLFF